MLFIVAEIEDVTPAAVSSGKTDTNNNTSVLWVEKFRPKSFIELLSDDGTNRTLLRWLKLWDKAVFNRDPKPPKPPKEQDAGKDGKFQEGNKFAQKSANHEVIEELDKDGRPAQKVNKNIFFYLFWSSFSFFIFFPLC